MNRQYSASAEGGTEGVPSLLAAFPLSAATTPIPTLPFVGLLTPLDRPDCGRVPGEAVSGASRQVRPISRARRGAVVANVGVDAGIAAEQHLPGSEPPLSRCEFPGVVIAGKDRPPAAFVHAIRRIGRIFVAGSIGTGPGWKICVAKLVEFDYIRQTDRDFSSATSLPGQPRRIRVRPGHNFSRTSPERLQAET